MKQVHNDDLLLDTELEITPQISVDYETALTFFRFQLTYKEGPKGKLTAEEMLGDYLLTGGNSLSPSRKASMALGFNYLESPQTIVIDKPADAKVARIYECFTQIPYIIENEINRRTSMGELLLDYAPFTHYLGFLSTGRSIRDYINYYKVKGSSFDSEALTSAKLINAVVLGKFAGFPNKIVMDHLFSDYIDPKDRDTETLINKALYYYISGVLVNNERTPLLADADGEYYDVAFKTQLKRFFELAVVYDYFKRKPTGDLGIFKQARIMSADNPQTINTLEYYKTSASMGRNPRALVLAIQALLEDTRKQYITFLKEKGVPYSSNVIETSLSAGAIFLENALIAGSSKKLNIAELKRSRIKDAIAILEYLHQKVAK